jgi:putative copper export protein
MIDGAWLVLRAAGLVLSLQAIGAALFAARVTRQLDRSMAVVRAGGQRAALAALAVLAAQLLVGPAELGGEAAALLDGFEVRLFLTTSTAAALLTRFAGAACLVAGLRTGARAPYPLAVAGSMLMIGSFILTGHTVAQPQRLALACLLFVHVTIVGFWFGALRPLRQVIALESTAVASAVLTTFSALAVWLVPMIALAGAAIAVLLLPDVGGLLRPYGLLLLTKLALFALLMGLAGLNRLRLSPALAAGSATAPQVLRRSIGVEWGLICVVLAVTAVMSGNFSPEPATQHSRESAARAASARA